MFSHPGRRKGFMRPTATESLYKDLEQEYGQEEYSLPVDMALRPMVSKDLDQTVALEDLCFPENERATRQKIQYRLSVCPELCVAVVKRTYDWNGDSQNSDHLGVASAKVTVKSEQIIGHILATKTNSEFVTDASMGIPTVEDSDEGHIETGRTIAIHSVCVHPDYRNKHIGYLLLKDYVQRFFSLQTADGIAILVHDELVPFYQRHGFHLHGKAPSTFGGTEWKSMRLRFDGYDSQSEP